MKKFLSKISHSKNPGESLIEVLVAVVILSTVLTATFAILNRTISTNVNVKNRVIAINIAREGLEAVRNIRDTNWLKYSGDRRGKWLCLELLNNNKTAIDTDCFPNSTSQITDEKYLVDFAELNDESRRYFLSVPSEQDELDLKTATSFGDYRLYQDATSGRYTHDSSSNTSTIFYRQIELEVENPLTETFCTTSDDCKNAKLKVIARVQWREGEAVRTLVLETYLFDFLERTEY